MGTLIFAFPPALNQLALKIILFAGSETVTQILAQAWSVNVRENFAKSLHEILVPLISALIATAAGVIFRKPLRRRWDRFLPHVRRLFGVKAEPSGPEAVAEYQYLDWVKLYIPDPLPDLKRPIRIPANPRLVRYNTVFSSHPLIKEIGLSEKDEFAKGSEIQDLIRELKREKQKTTIVLGDPGSGKSVCLRQLARDLCEAQVFRSRPQTLPLYVEMKGYDEWDDALDQPGDLLEFLTKSLTTHPSRQNDPEHHPPRYVAEHLPEILGAGRATVIFDALDEMPQQTYRQRTDALKRFVKHWKGMGPDNRFVFSCRQFDYTDPLSTDRFPVNEIVIEPFDESRILQYLKNNLTDSSSADAFYKAIERKETLREAVSNPFFLNALTEVRNKHNGELPNTRSEVIKAYVETLLTGIENDKDTKDDFEKIDGGLPALRVFLSELGFSLQLTGTSAHPDSLSELWKRYPQWQEMVSLALAGRILREEPDYTARPRNTPSRRIEFKHHRLQEYFAAEALAQRFNSGAVIEHYLKDIWWQEVVLFAIASVNDKHSIIEGMLSVRKQTEEWITQVLAQARETEMSEAALRLVSEIEKNCDDWRASYSDLPLTLSVLSRVIRVLETFKTDSVLKTLWDDLSKSGESLADCRDLFIAAEAIGLLAGDEKDREAKRIRQELNMVIREGDVLHKVRALRALSFIASDECIPLVETGLEDADPWVQSTALRTLFRLDLREKTPKKALTTFLLKKFQESLSWNVFDDGELLPEVSRYFHFNKGLTSGLLKEPGGRRLTLVSIPLWFASSVVSAAVAFFYMIVAVIVFAVSAVAVIVFLALFIAFVAIVMVLLLVGLILTAPLWSRGVFGESEVSRAESLKQRVGLAALDYALAGLLLWQGLPYGFLRPAIFLVIFVVLLAFSWMADQINERSKEPLRVAIGCFVAAFFGWLGNRSLQLDLPTLAIYSIALIQGILLTVWLVYWIRTSRQGLAERVLVIAFALLGFFERRKKGQPSDIEGTNEVQQTASEPPGDGAATAADPSSVEAGGAAVTIGKPSPSWPKVFLWITAGVAIIAAGAYVAPYIAARLISLKQQHNMELGPWLRSLVVFHKYHLYGTGGLIAFVGFCWFAIICLWFAWDEVKIIETIRRYLVAKGDVPQEKTADFVALMFEEIRDDSLPVRRRVQAVSTLRIQYPRTDEDHLHDLRKLAREELPIRVRTVLFQAIEAKRKIREQSRSHAVEVDPTELDQSVEAYWKEQRGSIMRPLIHKILYALLGSAVLSVPFQLYLHLGNVRMINVIALVELLVGGGLIYGFVSRARRSNVHKWLLLTGLILICVGITHPLQKVLIEPGWSNLPFNFGFELIDRATLRALIVPTLVACVAAQLGHTLYLLENGTKIAVNTEGKSGAIDLKRARLKAKPWLLSISLVLALLATVTQSRPLQEWLDLRNQSMPFFVMNEDGKEIELRNLPTDGRVVRVALVKVEPDPNLKWEADPTSPAAYDVLISSLTNEAESQHYTPLLERTFPFTLATAKKLKRKEPEDARNFIYAGEIWLSYRNGQIESWQPFKDSCLELPRVDGSAATFTPSCKYIKKRNRLVAIVYNTDRSGYVKGRAAPSSALSEFELNPPSNTRVLVDTLSPFVRTVWTPIF